MNPTSNPLPRWMALISGVVLLCMGLSMRFAPAIWDGQRWLATDTFSKVGLVLICMWLAWPGVEAIRRAPGGTMLMIACALVLGLADGRGQKIGQMVVPMGPRWVGFAFQSQVMRMVRGVR